MSDAALSISECKGTIFISYNQRKQSKKNIFVIQDLKS